MTTQRLINANEFWEDLDLAPDDWAKGRTIKAILDDVPTVDAEPVRHGRWVNPHMNKYGHPCHHCSECGFLASQKDRNYCPNCGAKMDLEE